MNYWHLQLQPEDKISIETIKNVLKIKKVIGLGDYWEDKNGNPVSDPTFFKKDMKIGDIVMIRETTTPIALVRITGDYFLEQNADYQFDWFPLRRSIEIISFFDENIHQNLLNKILKEYNTKYIQASKTLTFCENDNATNNFIWQWYNLEIEKMKLVRKLNILKYKKQIILQGPPGTGKTREAKSIADKILNADNEGLMPISLIESFFKNNSLISDNLGFQKKLQEFQSVFPKDQFLNMELADYCIGKGNRSNFCWWLERGLEQYGKFTPGQSGNYVIYFSHSEQDYVVKKFNEPINEVFPKLLDTLNNLVNKEDIQSALNFFGESFILKILNSYYPDKYFPINGKKALENAVKIFNIDTKRKSAIELNKILQEKFLELKNKNNSTVTALDFMIFLFKNFNLNEDGLMISDFEGKISKRKPAIIQFHPSYTYEDFVRGIVAKSTDKGIVYTVENKILTEISKEAYENQYLDYVLIIDEINRANLSSVLGELIYALEYRYFFDDSEEKQSESKVESPYSLIDENTGETSREIFLPENLYIIGTMNTADRSVGHIDYAIRRRFAFVDVLPEKLEDTEDIFFNTPGFVEVAKLFIKVGEDEVINFENSEDSDFLSNDFSSKDVALGHSYFIADRKKISEEEKDNYFKMKMKYEVIPILNEYLRDGVFNESATAKIKDIEQRFA